MRFRFNEISIKTMGQLINEHLNPDNKRLTFEVDVSKDSFMSFHIQLGSDYYKNKCTILESIVFERNSLVHHSLFEFNMKTLDSCLQIEKKLDNQENRIKKEIKELQSIAEYIEDFKTRLVNFIKSENFKSEFKLSWLRDSPLVILLSDISMQIAREDGWASLSIAGKLIRQYAPDEIAILKEKYSYKSLKPLIIGAGIFDLLEEQNKKNGTTLLYRVKPEIHLLNVKQIRGTQ